MKRRLLPVMISALGLLAACNDIFEKDLTGERVDIIAPSDDITVTPGEVTFLWHEVEGASSYHLQITAGEGFAVADTLLRNDSTTVRRSFRQHLDPGDYRWSVQAKNGAYQSQERVSTLHVVAEEDIADISAEEISIILPHDGAKLAPGDVTFLWREVKEASSYRITIVSPDFGSATALIADETLSSCSFTATIPAGHYQWSLQAANDGYETTEQLFSFEIADPEEPQENTP